MSAALKIPEAWDLVSEAYLADLGVRFKPWHQDGINELSSTLKKDSSKVLDLACGPGNLTMKLAGLAKEVIAMDFSAGMIATNKLACEKAGIKNVKFEVGDGQDLSRFADNTFDVAVSFFGLIFFPDKVKALKELKRVVKPGGKILISSWAPAEQCPAMQVAQVAMASAVPKPKEDNLKLAADTNDNPISAWSPSAGFENPVVIQKSFHDAGLSNPNLSISVHSWSYESAEAYWKFGHTASAPIAFAKAKKIPAEMWPKVSEAAIACLKKIIPEGTKSLSATAYMISTTVQ